MVKHVRQVYTQAVPKSLIFEMVGIQLRQPKDSGSSISFVICWLLIPNLSWFAVMLSMYTPEFSCFIVRTASNDVQHYSLLWIMLVLKKPYYACLLSFHADVTVRPFQAWLLPAVLQWCALTAHCGAQRFLLITIWSRPSRSRSTVLQYELGIHSTTRFCEICSLKTRQCDRSILKRLLAFGMIFCAVRACSYTLWFAQRASYWTPQVASINVLALWTSYFLHEDELASFLYRTYSLDV